MLQYKRVKITYRKIKSYMANFNCFKTYSKGFEQSYRSKLRYYGVSTWYFRRKKNRK